MFHNTLFVFINGQTTKDLKAHMGAAFLHHVLKTAVSGQQYHLMALATSPAVIITDTSKHTTYTCVEHHLSIYDKKSVDPMLGQYHYTAVFTEGEARYRLHVYFNARDERTAEPVLSIWDEEHAKWKDVALSYDLSEAFIQLAEHMGRDTIRPLKMMLEQRIKTLTMDYEEQDKCAGELGEGYSAHLDRYLAALSICRATLLELSPLTEQPYFKKRLLFTDHLIAALSSPASMVSSSEAMDMEWDCSWAGDGFELSTKVVTDDEHPMTMAKSPSIRFENDVAALKKRSDDYFVTHPLNAKELALLISDAMALSIQFESQSSGAFVPGLKTLYALQRQLQCHSTYLLPRLLVADDLVSAAYLPSAHYIISEQHVRLALITRKHELLDFVLRHGHLSVNTQPISILGKTYPTALHACIALHSKEKPMNACFPVLIDHGANLLLMDEIGLPLVYTLFSESPDYSDLRGSLYLHLGAERTNSFLRRMTREVKKLAYQMEKAGNPLASLLLHQADTYTEGDVSPRLVISGSMDETLTELSQQICRDSQTYIGLLTEIEKEHMELGHLHFYSNIHCILEKLRILVIKSDAPQSFVDVFENLRRMVALRLELKQSSLTITSHGMKSNRHCLHRQKQFQELTALETDLIPSMSDALRLANKDRTKTMLGFDHAHCITVRAGVSDLGMFKRGQSDNRTGALIEAKKGCIPT